MVERHVSNPLWFRFFALAPLSEIVVSIKILPTGVSWPFVKEDEIALIRVMPDAEVTRRTGRSSRAVWHQRKILGFFYSIQPFIEAVSINGSRTAAAGCR
jgi:hypothetical protein